MQYQSAMILLFGARQHFLLKPEEAAPEASCIAVVIVITDNIHTRFLFPNLLHGL
jgi:hypothetical protein